MKRIGADGREILAKVRRGDIEIVRGKLSGLDVVPLGRYGAPTSTSGTVAEQWWRADVGAKVAVAWLAAGGREVRTVDVVLPRLDLPGAIYVAQNPNGVRTFFWDVLTSACLDSGRLGEKPSWTVMQKQFYAVRATPPPARSSRGAGGPSR